MRAIARETGRIPYAAATALAVVLLSTIMAGPAWANHTQTCEFIDGVRVCTPDEHTPPAVNANNGSVVVNEGQTASNSGRFSDPDGNGTVTLSASVGTVTKDDANGTWSWTFRTSDGPDQGQTVTITASDGADSVATTFSLGVNNVAPTVTLQNGFTTVQEGGSFALGYTSYGYNLSVSDPGNDSWTLNTSCGSNGSEWQESSFTVWCGFFDGPATGTVSATATDSDGASHTATVNVTVTNRDPVAALDAPASIDEGGTATLSLVKGNFSTQDGQADTTAGFRYAFDCNGGPLDGATYASSGTDASTNCTFDDSGARSVRARIIDKDGGFTEYTRKITVNNVAPTATLGAPASVDQGSNFTISLSNVTEPSGADGSALSYAFDCGDGLGFVALGTPSKGCTALDRPSMMVRGRVTDKDGGTNEYARTVSINNVAPTGTVRINDGAPATNNATVRLALAAADPLPGSGVGHMRFRNENTQTWSAWEPYSTGRSWLLSSGDGAKTVHVEYRDNAGNVSTAAIEDGILLDSQLDTNAPGTTITSGPTGVVNLASASFGLASSETGSTFECRLDGGAFAACTSPKGYTGLSNGSHTFSVRARDAAGNVDVTPATRTWTVDTIKPTISGMSPGHGSVVRDTTPTIRATVKDNRPLNKGNIKLYVAGREISPARFGYAASTGLLVYNSPSLAKGKKTVKVVATDGARNAGTKSWYFTIR